MTHPMKWFFASNDGGRDSGFNDAGIETFRGNLDRFLAREVLQNSVDARPKNSKKAVCVKFDVIHIDRNDIPDFDTLHDAFSQCHKYWSKDRKAREFFSQAMEISQQPQIPVLRIQDFNTTGVPGGDRDREQNWYSLVRCAGSSSKGGGEGGSYGIGKNAPFAASKFRTVLYSTCTGDNQHAFQGVSTLVSHALSEESETKSATGFLGGDRGASIRNQQHIPEIFRRSEQGLNVYVLAYHAEMSWQEHLTYSVLDNFWPAIEFGNLEVSIGKVVVNRDTLPELMKQFSAKEDFSAHLYHEAFKNPTKQIEHTLNKLKSVSLHLLTGDYDLPKRIALVRKTGMVVDCRLFRSVLPFCGVFMCRNDTGNEKLREMEPPRHDSWDPDHPEKGVNKAIDTEYRDFIRSCIKELVSTDDSKIITVPGLNRFLPDDDDTPETSFDEPNEATTQETPDRRPLPVKIAGRKIDPARLFMQPNESMPDDSDGMTEDVTDEGTSGGRGTDQNDADGGKGRGGGNGDGDYDAVAGAKGGTQAKPAIPIRYRTFLKDFAGSTYALTVDPGKDVSKTALIHVNFVGDDQRMPAPIRRATLASGEDIPVHSAGVIGPVELNSTPLRIEVVLIEPLRVAMEVSANET